MSGVAEDATVFMVSLKPVDPEIFRPLAEGVKACVCARSKYSANPPNEIDLVNGDTRSAPLLMMLLNSVFRSEAVRMSPADHVWILEIAII
jgi:hypothetical protein